MEKRHRAYTAAGAIVGIFLVVQLGALALVEPFKSAGYQPVENPQDPTNSVVYVAAILLATGGMLLVMRYDVEWLLRAIIVFSGSYLSLYAFSVLVPPVVTLSAGGVAVNGLAAVLAALLGGALWLYPEWYVVDAAGVTMGVAAAGLFGISFGVLPALLLLLVLAVYDAISVYGTEHMLTLATGVLELRVPVVLVVPLSLSYSFLDAETPDPTAEDGDAGEDDGATATGGSPTADGGESRADPVPEDDATDDPSGTADGDEPDPLDRDALFIGLGDAVIPTVLVASAGFFAPPSVPSLGVPGLALTLPALSAMVGTLLGLVALLRMVLRGRAHAGLPLLNGGAIAGYLLGALASGLTLVEALGLAGYL